MSGNSESGAQQEGEDYYVVCPNCFDTSFYGRTKQQARELIDSLDGHEACWTCGYDGEYFVASQAVLAVVGGEKTQKQEKRQP